MAERGSDSDLQIDAVPGDAHEDLEQKFQAQSLQHRNPSTDPRNWAKSKTSGVEKSNTSEEVEDLQLHHCKCNSEADDVNIDKYRHLLPPDLQADFYDGIIEYCEDNDDDEIGAKQFLHRIKTEVVLDGGEAPKVVLYNEMHPGDGTTPVELLDHIIMHCTYKFLYVTESFCKDRMKTRSFATCLMESVYVPEQNYTVVPIFTTDKYNAPYKIPPSIRSLIGVNYYKDSAFPAEKLRRLFQPKLAYREEQEEVMKQKRVDFIRQSNVLRQKTAEERRTQKLKAEEKHILALKSNFNCMTGVQPGNVGHQKDVGLSVGTTSTQVSHTLSQDVLFQPSLSKLNAVPETRADDNKTLNTVRHTDRQENTSTCREIPETRSEPDGDAAEQSSTHAADLPPTSTSANVADTFNTTKRPVVIASEEADEGSAPNENGTGQAYASVECLQADDLVADHSQHVSKATPSRTPSSTAPFCSQGCEGAAAGDVILMEDTTVLKAKVYDENANSASALASEYTRYSEASGTPDPRKDFIYLDKSVLEEYTRSVSDAKASANVYSRGAGRPPCARAAHACDLPPPYADHQALKSACARRDSPPPPYFEHVQQHGQQPTVVVHNHYYGKVRNVYRVPVREPVPSPRESQPTITYNINAGTVGALMIGGRNQRFTSDPTDSSLADTTGDQAEEECVAEQEVTKGGIQETGSLEPETAWKYGSDLEQFFTPRSPGSGVHSEDSDDEDTLSKMA